MTLLVSLMNIYDGLSVRLITDLEEKMNWAWVDLLCRCAACWEFGFKVKDVSIYCTKWPLITLKQVQDDQHVYHQTSSETEFYLRGGEDHREDDTIVLLHSIRWWHKHRLWWEETLLVPDLRSHTHTHTHKSISESLMLLLKHFSFAMYWFSDVTR